MDACAREGAGAFGRVGAELSGGAAAGGLTGAGVGRGAAAMAVAGAAATGAGGGATTGTCVQPGKPIIPMAATAIALTVITTVYPPAGNSRCTIIYHQSVPGAAHVLRLTCGTGVRKVAHHLR